MTRINPRSLALVTAVILAAVVVAPSTLFGGTAVYVGSSVKSSQRVSMDRIDHSQWNTLLARYVDKNGMVNYREWHKSRRDLQALDQYLRRLSTGSVQAKSSRNSQLAFWINAYNAVTVKGIFREYPTSSIRNHTAKLWGYNIWKDLKLRVGGKAYSLEEIEHEILRKKGDPRIHFAIVCASRGCPRLLNEAYTAERVQQQLELNAKDFFARSQNFRHDVSQNRFQVSSILNWFADDFGRDRAAQLRRIAPWLPTEKARVAAREHSPSISYLDYDWSLNEQSTRTARRK